MTIHAIVLGVCALILGGPFPTSGQNVSPTAVPQEVQAGRPAPSNVRGQENPRILPDRRVIFRARAPQRVRLYAARV